MEEHTVGETRTIEDMEARVKELLDRVAREPRAPLFSVVEHPDGGFHSRFDCRAIGMALLGPRRETAEESVKDCMAALHGLLEQLGFNPEDCDVVAVKETKEPEPPKDAA